MSHYNLLFKSFADAADAGNCLRDIHKKYTWTPLKDGSIVIKTELSEAELIYIRQLEYDLEVPIIVRVLD